MNTQFLLPAAVASLLLAISFRTLADDVTTSPPQASEVSWDTPEQAITWRRDEFKSIERAIKKLRFSLVVHPDLQAAREPLALLKEKANAEHMLPAFRMESYGGESQARREIWENWETFAQGFADLEAKVDTLNQAAQAEDFDTAKQALSDVALSCKNCHRRFKER
ncbi:c-type cytochrome [Halomonas sp. WWR20]